MVTSSTSHLPYPKSWDEFEDICADLFQWEWNDNNTVRYGRQGQRQDGVDIYGRPDGVRYAGVQCKGKRKFPPPPLKISEINAEVEKAKAFVPALTELTIATAADDGGELQDHARRLTQQHAVLGLFSVNVIGWGELSRRITQHSHLLEKHFSFVGVQTLSKKIDALPRAIVEAIRDETAAGHAVPSIFSGGAEASIAQALERDLSMRYESAVRRSLTPEAGKIDEFQALADNALEQQYSAVSPALRRRVLLRAARSAAVRGSVARAEALLEAAEYLIGEDSDVPARARIAEAQGDINAALAILRDCLNPDCRSTLFNVLFRARGHDAALEWYNEEKLSTPLLTIYGVHTLVLCHLQKNDIEGIRNALDALTPDQAAEAPFFLSIRASALMASVVPGPERDGIIAGLPLDVRRVHVAINESDAAIRLDKAAADLASFLSLAATLGLKEAKRIAEAYVTWCDLLHPHRKLTGLERLRKEMADPKAALSRVQFAFAYDSEFQPEKMVQYLARREELGGLDDLELRAKLVLLLHADDPGAVATLIAKYRPQFEAGYPAGSMICIEIQALAMAGEATSARVIFEAHRHEFPSEVLAGLEAEVAKAEGVDPVAADLRAYQITNTTETLRSLLGSVIRKSDHRAIARYSEELYLRTGDLQDVARAAQAFINLGDGKEFVRVMEARPLLKERKPGLARQYGWELFRMGRLKTAKEIADSLPNLSTTERDLQLEIAIAIESGEWESLAVPLAAYLENTSKYSGIELIRAAHLAQASGSGPMMDLLNAAIVKADTDPNVWLGAYRLIMEEGLEEDVPQAHEWFQRAFTLSGADGPVQRYELKDLIPQQHEWNKRTLSISASIVQGDVPFIIAAEGLRTTVTDIFLRNLVRNAALTDARNRVALSLFSGNRAPVACGELTCLAFDISSLLVLGWLGLLSAIFRVFEKIALPATVLTELFDGRRRVQRFQKSRIRRAEQIQQAIARGRIKVVRCAVRANDPLNDEVGLEFAALVRAAEDAKGVVLRPAPVHRPGLDQIDAIVCDKTESLTDMQTLLAVLVDRGAVDESTEQTAKAYFDLHDSRWPNAAQPKLAEPLYIDDVALAYLQYTGLFDIVMNVFKDVRVDSEIEREVLSVIDHSRHVTETLSKIDEMRVVIRDANAAGKVVFGPRRVEREEDEDGISLSTLHLLSDLTGADAVVCDDRSLNKESFAQDLAGKRVRCLTTLDLIEELHSRRTISDAERRMYRHKLRTGGATLMPVEGNEIAVAAMRSGASRSAELKAIVESIDLARVAEIPRFPREAPWFASLNMTVRVAIFEIWKAEKDFDRAAMFSDQVMDLLPRLEDWIVCWRDTPPPDWVEAVTRISVASLSIPVELEDEAATSAYNQWLERRVLEPLRSTAPERYRGIVANIKDFIERAREDHDEAE